MKLSQFDYEFPEELIATKPLTNRDEARLMVLDRKTGTIEHKMFSDVIDYFDDQDTMIVNNTSVFPARLYGQKEKTGANIEVFLLRELNSTMRLWDVMVDPARKIRVGNKIFFGEDDLLVAEVVDNTTSRGRTIRFIFDGDDDEFKNILNSLGETPLPKFVEKEEVDNDLEYYQSYFAKYKGAVAAPTASFHFSRELIKKMQIKGVNFADVTLHTGLAAFNPIDVEDLAKFKMDAEYFEVNDESTSLVNASKLNKRRVCAVGTSTIRSIESSVTAQGMLKSSEGWTNEFIYPPFEFNIANALITNFHRPKSSTMIMVAAFGGYDLVMEAYQEAIKEKYRFLNYGDSMLII